MDTNQRFSKPKTQQLVPPPPAVPVQSSYPDFLQGPQIAQAMTTQPPPATMPQPMTLQFGAPTRPVSPETQQLLGQRAKQVDAARQALTEMQGGVIPNVEAPKTTPFEAQMEQAMQARLADALSNKSSAMDRFNTGRNFGQKLAGDIIVPLMGTFSRNAGSAAGAAEATQQIQQQIATNDAQERQDRAARNQTLANLSQVWENMSPSSTKNALALAHLRLENATKQAAEKRQAALDALAGATASFNATKGIAEEETKGYSAENKANIDAGKLADETTKTANTGKANDQKDERGNRALDIKDKAVDANIQTQNDRTGIMGQNANTNEKNAETKRDQGQQKINIDKHAKEQAEAGKAVRTLSTLTNDIGAIDPKTGKLKHPTLLEDTLNNPAVLDEMDKQMGTPGAARKALEGLKAQRDAATTAAAQPQQGNDVFSQIGSMIGGLMPGNRSASAPTAKKDALPVLQKETPKEDNSTRIGSAIEALHAKLGHIPSAAEIKEELNKGKKGK